MVVPCVSIPSNDIHAEYWEGRLSSLLEPVHMHDSYEVFYLVSGRYNFSVEGNICQLGNGCLAFLRPRERHFAFCSPHEAVYYRIGIKPAVLTELAAPGEKERLLSVFKTRQILLPENMEGQVTALFNRLYTECRELNSLSHMMMRLIFLEIAVTLSRFLDREPVGGQPDSGLSSTHHILFNRAVQYMTENYQKPIALSEIARVCDVSDFYFSRFFKQAAGMSFSQCLNTIRIQAAKKLLEETDLSVEKIAGQAGFCSATYFIRLFREMEGTSPRCYRVMHCR